MPHFPDDLFLGGFSPAGLDLNLTQPGPRQLTQGVGPMGRIYVHNIQPLALATANVAALQHTTAATPLVLAAGAGATLGVAPDGSGSPVIQFDVERAVSLTSAANMSGQNFAITGFDVRGVKMSQLLAGPNANTVNTLKAFFSVLSVVPSATDGANNVSVGSSDIFGLPFLVADAGYIMPKWNNALAQDAGTFVAADATSPATNATGDTCGTYKPSAGASDGVKRLVVWMHLTAIQCGPNATKLGLLGVPQA